MHSGMYSLALFRGYHGYEDSLVFLVLIWKIFREYFDKSSKCCFFSEGMSSIKMVWNNNFCLLLDLVTYKSFLTTYEVFLDISSPLINSSFTKTRKPLTFLTIHHSVITCFPGRHSQKPEFVWLQIEQIYNFHHFMVVGSSQVTDRGNSI